MPAIKLLTFCYSIENINETRSPCSEHWVFLEGLFCTASLFPGITKWLWVVPVRMRRAAACVFVFAPGLRGAVPACRMTQQPWRFLEKHFRLLQVKIVLAAKLPLLAAFLSELQEKQFNVCGSAYPSKMQRCLRLLGCYYGWCLWRRNVLSIPQAWTSFSSWSQLAYPSHAGSPSFWLLLVSDGFNCRSDIPQLPSKGKVIWVRREDYKSLSLFWQSLFLWLKRGLVEYENLSAIRCLTLEKQFNLSVPLYLCVRAWYFEDGLNIQEHLMNSKYQ